MCSLLSCAHIREHGIFLIREGKTGHLKSRASAFAIRAESAGGKCSHKIKWAFPAFARKRPPTENSQSAIGITQRQESATPQFTNPSQCWPGLLFSEPRRQILTDLSLSESWPMTTRGSIGCEAGFSFTGFSFRSPGGTCARPGARPAPEQFLPP